MSRVYKGHEHKYTPQPWSQGDDSVSVQWSLRGPRGAIHLHCSSHMRDGIKEWSCGIEYHFAVRGERTDAPDYVNCPFVGGWCWHDGTSLGASEFWENHGGKQAFQRGDHRFIFAHLEMCSLAI